MQVVYHRGKVRDCYDLGDTILLIATDRMTAFDRYLAQIPHKGKVLNQLSFWWFEKTRHLVPNAAIKIAGPRAMLMEKCCPYPIEFVVRGYLTGSTSTSIWHLYQQGARRFGNITLPDGMKKNDRLPRPILTPSTKAAVGDRPISVDEIINQQLICRDEMKMLEEMAMTLFQFGQQEAQKKNLVLVDTKYEFGKDQHGQIKLIDEVHTPDSSRYWCKTTYGDYHEQGLEPQSFDKEILRLWYKDHCDPYVDAVLPKPPANLSEQVTRSYIHVYESLTSRSLSLGD